MNEQVQEIFVEDIIPNRFQPRLTFDEKALQELANSIKVHGVIQPLVLRRVGNKYEIIAGERRYKASCIAGLKKVPAVVREMNDNESAEVALIENVQRKNLSSIEEAQSYKNLLDRDYMTQEELASKLGVAQSTIANKLRLLNLCDEVQNALLNEQISERHARSLLQLSNPDEQKSMLDRIIKERLTVKQLDTEIKKLLQGETSEESNNEGGISMKPNNNVGETVLQEEKPVNKSIFGFQVPPSVDLESSAPNLSTGLEGTIPPVSFNPFSGGDMISSFENTESNLLDNSDSLATENVSNDESNNKEDISNPASSITEEPLETFDMFGDIISNNDSNEPEEKIDPFDISEEPKPSKKVSIGDQINSVRDVISSIEKAGFRVEKEEYDFNDVYQINIKINKSNL